MKRKAKQKGQWLEEQEEQVLTEINAAELIAAETRNSVSQPGRSHVLLTERGQKKGLKNKQRKRTPRETQ